MSKFLKSLILSFKNAFSGIGHVVRTQKNSWIHLTASVIAIFLGFYFKLDHLEWALIVFSIAFVWGAEFFNTSLETIFDILVETPHPLVKIGKDVGAAAVLISSIASLTIGFLIFFPKLLSL